jgi:hypothetical protein
MFTITTGAAAVAAAAAIMSTSRFASGIRELLKPDEWILYAKVLGIRLYLNHFHTPPSTRTMASASASAAAAVKTKAKTVDIPIDSATSSAAAAATSNKPDLLGTHSGSDYTFATWLTTNPNPTAARVLKDIRSELECFLQNVLNAFGSCSFQAAICVSLAMKSIAIYPLLSQNNSTKQPECIFSGEQDETVIQFSLAYIYPDPVSPCIESIVQSQVFHCSNVFLVVLKALMLLGQTETFLNEFIYEHLFEALYATSDSVLKKGIDMDYCLQQVEGLLDTIICSDKVQQLITSLNLAAYYLYHISQTMIT